jgi:hypothetical protein
MVAAIAETGTSGACRWLMPPSQDDRREPIYEEMPQVWPHQTR